MSASVMEPDVCEVLRQQHGRMRVAELAEATGIDPSKVTVHAIRLPGVRVDGDEAVLELSADESHDLERLEAVFERGQRESIAALREIRERKLYRVSYKTFDAYMEDRWGRTRQWATQKLNWLRRVELLEAIGKNPYQISVDDAQTLGSLEEYPDEFVRALREADEEAGRTGKKRSKKMLLEAVAQQQDYLTRRRKSADLTYGESVVLASLGSGRMSQPNLVAEAAQQAKEQEKSLGESLVEVCQGHRALPSDEHLLAVARGEELAALCQPLIALRSAWEQESDLEKEERELTKKLADIQRQRKAKQATAPAKPAAGSDDEIEAESDEEADERLDEEHDEEPEEIVAQYRVRATGDFAELFGAEEDGAEVMLSMEEFIDEMFRVMNDLQDGATITAESSITISPVEPQQEE